MSAPALPPEGRLPSRGGGHETKEVGAVSLLRTLACNLASMSAMRLGSALISFAVFWYLARSSDASFVGAYAFLLGVYAFLQQLPLLGLHLAAVRDVAADANAAPRIAANLGALGFATAVLMGIACYGTGLLFYPPDMHAAFALLGLAMLPTAWINVAEGVLIGRQNMSTVAAVNLVESVLRALFSAVAVWQNWGLEALFLIFCLGRLGSAIAYSRSADVPAWQARLLDWRALRRLLAECPVFFGIMLLSAAVSRFDLFFLSRLGSFTELGVYAVAAKIYEATLMAPSVITSVLYPAFSQLAAQDARRMEVMLRTALAWVFILALPCALLVGMLAASLIRLAFGPTYVAAAPVLQLLMVALVLVALNQLLTLALLSRHEQRADLYSLLASTLAMVLLLAVLIPLHGMLGAAQAVVLTMLLQMVMRYAFVRHRLQLRPGLGALWRPLAAGAAMLSTGLLPLPLAVVLPLALGTYVAVLYATGVISPEAVRAAMDLLRARRGVTVP